MAKDTAQNTYELITGLLEAGIPGLITGPPGVGKTGFVYDLAKRKFQGKQVKILSMIASNRESTDIGGYPHLGSVEISSGEKVEVVKFAPIDWAVRAKDYVEQGFFTIVFIDEYRDITPPVLAALNKCVHENQVGDFSMPKEVRWLAAANSIEDSTVGVALPLPTANRWAHVSWDIHRLVQPWVEGMISNSFALQTPLSEEALKRLPMERAKIAAFIHKRPELIHKVPVAEDEKDGPWPSPRTLDTAAHGAAAVGNDEELQMRIMASLVGDYVTAEYIAYKKSMDLPDPEKVLSGEFKDVVNEARPDITYAILSSVVSVIAGKWTGERYLNAWKVFGRAADKGAGDIAAALTPAIESTTNGRTNVPDPTEHIAKLLPILAKAGVSLR